MSHADAAIILALVPYLIHQLGLRVGVGAGIGVGVNDYSKGTHRAPAASVEATGRKKWVCSGADLPPVNWYFLAA